VGKKALHKVTLKSFRTRPLHSTQSVYWSITKTHF